MSNGYMGKILWVNLSDNSFNEEELSEEVYRQYIGGYGLATKLIYETMPAKTDPLGPDSVFGFFPGLITGTVAPLTGRFMVAGKSPLTGTWGDANCGGYFGPEVKKCGYDAILIRGIAENPKYVAVIGDNKQILDASELWGLDTVQTEEKLTEKHGRVQVASIGQSGENMSLISGIVNDKARIAARSGFGAVMGSKKLKAIVLKGEKKITIADNESLLQHTKEYNEGIYTATAGGIAGYKTLGTTMGNVILFTIGDTPAKNWGGNKEDFPEERLNNISGENIFKYVKKPYGCFSCPIRCGAIMNVPEVGLVETHRPEYETCASFGHLLLNDDLMSIFTLNDLCNRAGIDTISAGTTIAFAIECFENGIIGLDDTEGLKLEWGNSESIVELLKRMINREGIGDILADGVKVASEKIGRGSSEYAMHSLGQELGMHSPKYYKDMAATFAFDPTPGRHTTASLDFFAMGPIIKPNGLFEGLVLPKRWKRPSDDRNEAERIFTAIMQFTHSIGLCEFAYVFQKYPLFELIKAVVGWDLTIDEAVKTGIRIQTLRQAFTLREGIEIIKNKLPNRTTDVNYLEHYKGYCEKIGWNPENGQPLKETLEDLELDYVIKDFY